MMLNAIFNVAGWAAPVGGDEEGAESILLKVQDPADMENVRQFVREYHGKPMMLVSADFQQEPDLLGEFLEECCIVQATSGELSLYLYHAFQAWCSERGKLPPEKFWSVRRFAVALHMRPNLHKGFIRGMVVWSGVSLCPEWRTKVENELGKGAQKVGGAS